MYALPGALSLGVDAETISFEAIQLSTQGSERQRKDVPCAQPVYNILSSSLLFYLWCFLIGWSSKIMKVSQRFEILMQQRRLQPDAASMTDGDLLQSIVSKFNNFKANAALKKWQVTPDQHSAILGIVCGMTQESRQLVRAHLDHNKWEQSGFLASNISSFQFFRCYWNSWSKHYDWKQTVYSSGYNESILRMKRHQLHQSPKGVTGIWQDILTEAVLVSGMLFFLGFLLLFIVGHYFEVFTLQGWTWFPGDTRLTAHPLPKIQPLVGPQRQESQSHYEVTAEVVRRSLVPKYGSRMYRIMGCAGMQKGTKCISVWLQWNCICSALVTQNVLENRTNLKTSPSLGHHMIQVTQDMVDAMMSGFMNGSFGNHRIFAISWFKSFANFTLCILLTIDIYCQLTQGLLSRPRCSRDGTTKQHHRPDGGHVARPYWQIIDEKSGRWTWQCSWSRDSSPRCRGPDYS